MSVFSRVHSLTLLAALALSLVGCKQGEGEVCDVDGDCEMGLSCCGGGDDGLPLARGICQPEAAPCADRPDPVEDAGPRPDSGPEPDGGPTPTADAGPDASTAADAGTDAATPDPDGGTDAGATDDAGADAGDAS